MVKVIEHGTQSCVNLWNEYKVAINWRNAIEN
jgi:uncharacterized protein involved in tolerance to divalent cations